MISSNRENCGRERLIGTATKKKMIETVLENRFLTAEDLYSDENINHNNVSVHTICCMLNEKGLRAYKPKVISLVSEVKK
jgi:hypothetical protein